MKALLVLLSSVALASCNPTLDLLSGLLNGGSGGGAGGHGGAGEGAGCMPRAAISGIPGAGSGIGGGGGGGGTGLPVIGGLPLVGSLLGGGKTDRGLLQQGGVYPVGGGGLFQALGFLAQGLTDVAGNARSVLDDIIHLRIPGILDDGFNAVISVGRAAGGIINAFIPGLGSLLGNLVVAIGKIFICLFGSPGLTGSVLGDRRPGRDNPRDIPYICGPQYGVSWGCAYDGPYDNDASIINHYNVQNSYKQAQEYIDKCTNGAGLDSMSGSQRIISVCILAIARIMDKGSKNWTDDDILIVVINIITINAAIGDSYQPGLGVKIVDEWIINLKKNKNKKFPDLSKYRVDIINALKGTKEDKFGGAFDQTKRSEWERINKNESDRNTDTNRYSDNRNNTVSDSNTDNDGHGNNNKKETDRNTDNNGNNFNGGSNDGSEDLTIHDGSQYTSKKTDKISNAKSNSGSGKIEKKSDGGSINEYNYNNTETNSRERTAVNTDTRVHDLKLQRDRDDC